MAFIAILCLLAAPTGNTGEQGFPAEIYFHSGTETFNSKYDLVLKDCGIWYRNKDCRGCEWKKMKIHKKLRCPKQIYADSEQLIALDSTGKIFTMFGALRDNPRKFNWMKMWGAPFRLGGGMRVPLKNDGIAFSYLSPTEDSYYKAFNGGKYEIGKGCANIFVLNRRGQRITYLDPWLPNDLSYEVGGPRYGRFLSVGISSTGSTLFLINKYGDMYTRTYDFDMAGADDFFFNYSYDSEEYAVHDTSHILPRKFPRPLPLPGWKQQPKIIGEITDMINIVRTGKGTTGRELRVEGRNNEGHAGYYTKDVHVAEWQFQRTDHPLKGNPVENRPADMSDSTLGPDESFRFALCNDTLKIEIPNFHPYCSPAELIIVPKNDDTLRLAFHTHEKIRQTKRERGLTRKKLSLKGAIEVLDAASEEKRGRAKSFMQSHFKQKRFINIKVRATRDLLVVKGESGFVWRLGRN